MSHVQVIPAAGGLRCGEGSREDQASRLRAMVRHTPAGHNGSVRSVAQTEAHSKARPGTGQRTRSPIVALSSGKGGVGKTVLSVNLAIALAHRVPRIVLIDADVGTANADVLCGLLPSRRLDQIDGNGAGSDEGLLGIAIDAPGGFLLVPGSVGRAGDSTPSERSMANLVNRASRSTDAVLIDTGAGVGDEVLSILTRADLVVVVVTPDPTSIADAYALIKAHLMRARDHGATDPAEARLSLVVNMAQTEEEALRVHRRLAGVAQRFLGAAVPMIGWVCADATLARTVRERAPLMNAPGQSRARDQVRQVADGLCTRLGLDATCADTPPERPAWRLFGRWWAGTRRSRSPAHNGRPNRTPNGKSNA